MANIDLKLSVASMREVMERLKREEQWRLVEGTRASTVTEYQLKHDTRVMSDMVSLLEKMERVGIDFPTLLERITPVKRRSQQRQLF